jgi:rare lipoprotein A
MIYSVVFTLKNLKRAFMKFLNFTQNQFTSLRKVLVFLAPLLILSQCAQRSMIDDENKMISSESKRFDKSVFEIKESDEKPAWFDMKGEGIYKLGKPYKVNGTWYFPKEDGKYDEIGIASWYGPGFHQKITANGEYFDMDLVTAAHKTLPLPSVVRVTNLENGRSLLVRVNDRGPFVNDRIIDLSRKASELLGFIARGTAKVRVELMPEESLAVASYAQNQFVKNDLNAAQMPVASAGLVSVNQETGEPVKKEAQEVSQTFVDATTSSPEAYASENKDESLAGVVSALSDTKNTKVVTSEPVTQAGTQESIKKTVDDVSALSTYGKSYVQVGAFSSQQNAEKISSMLSSVGQATIEKLDRYGQSIYRVRFGPFDDAGEAQKVMDKILDVGHGDVHIVMD